MISGSPTSLNPQGASGGSLARILCASVCVCVSYWVFCSASLQFDSIQFHSIRFNSGAKCDQLMGLMEADLRVRVGRKFVAVLGRHSVQLLERFEIFIVSYWELKLTKTAALVASFFRQPNNTLAQTTITSYHAIFIIIIIIIIWYSCIAIQLNWPQTTKSLGTSESFSLT